MSQCHRFFWKKNCVEKFWGMAEFPPSCTTDPILGLLNRLHAWRIVCCVNVIRWNAILEISWALETRTTTCGRWRQGISGLCAWLYSGTWWFDRCTESKLKGHYSDGPYSVGLTVIRPFYGLAGKAGITRWESLRWTWGCLNRRARTMMRPVGTLPWFIPRICAYKLSTPLSPKGSYH